MCWKRLKSVVEMMYCGGFCRYWKEKMYRLFWMVMFIVLYGC